VTESVSSTFWLGRVTMQLGEGRSLESTPDSPQGRKIVTIPLAPRTARICRNGLPPGRNHQTDRPHTIRHSRLL
jgi:hypothetical protein